MSSNKYTQLCYAERIIIENRLANGESYSNIARALGRSSSTISREVASFVEEQIKRLPGRTRDKARHRVNTPKVAKLDGRCFRGRAQVSNIYQARDGVKKRTALLNRIYTYRAKLAQQYALERQLGVIRTPSRLLSEEYAVTLSYVQSKLRLRWSPEQIAMRVDVLIANPALQDSDGWSAEMGLRPISHMAIYRYIYSLDGKQKKKAVVHLRRRGKPFKNTAGLPYNNTNRGKHSIHDRPKVIDQLGRYGDLEGDTIFGRDSKDRLLTHVDRKSGLGSISLLIGYNALDIAKQTKRDIARVYGEGNAFTITYDNGIEFSAWRETEKQVQVDIYFADPYRSSQRGRNENFNGLIRDFLPKGTDFKKLSTQSILDIENLLNNRPRKRLNGLTPLEVFRRNCAVKVLS